MYVTFPVPVREAIELRSRYAQKGGFKAVVIGFACRMAGSMSRKAN